MAIIDPEGLFGGRRLRRCSDAARLYWPYFFLAADGFGRLELDYRLMVNRLFLDFKCPPAEDECWGFFREYQSEHLIFLYEVEGRPWGQWWCKPGSLPRYKTRKDGESPDPPRNEFDKWCRSYSSQNKAVPKPLGDLPKSSRKPTETLHTGVGGGEASSRLGEGVEAAFESPPTPQNPEDIAQVRQWICESMTHQGCPDWPPPDPVICNAVLLAKGDRTMEELHKFFQQLTLARRRPSKNNMWWVTVVRGEFMGGEVGDATV